MAWFVAAAVLTVAAVASLLLWGVGVALFVLLGAADCVVAGIEALNVKNRPARH